MSDPQAVFFEAFDGLARLAPGSEASTLRALALVRRWIEPRGILDLGCGSGAQTLVLARNTGAEIIAVDSHGPFLRTLEARVAAEGAGSRVRTLEASMTQLDSALFGQPFDLIWSEGSIYVAGFDAALRAWRDLLREDGVLACTDASWLVDSPSEEVRRFWAEAYPAMRSIEANLLAGRAAGYEPIGHFVLPEDDWVREYYGPLAQRLASMRAKYANDAVALAVIDSNRAEIDLFERARGEYGYVFYLLRRALGPVGFIVDIRRTCYHFDAEPRYSKWSQLPPREERVLRRSGLFFQRGPCLHS